MSTEVLSTTEAVPAYSAMLKARGIANASTPVARFFRWKPLFDRPLGAILLVLFAPVIGLLWFLVKLTSPGPGFYRQTRVGKSGRLFEMIKLRSMRQDAEAATGAIWCSQNDRRITRFGNFLRTFHLDELPQLMNVVRGEMSLVGPRPERPEFVEVLAKKLDDYCDRLAVAPGITGLAQLNLPPDTDLDSVARKLVLDKEYIRQGNLWLELRLLMCTATRLLKVPTISLLGLNRRVVLERDESSQPLDEILNEHKGANGDHRRRPARPKHAEAAGPVMVHGKSNGRPSAPPKPR